MILADLEINGSPRKVLMQAPKNGFFYVLDRATGELLSADPIVELNWASHVDLKTGRPVETGRAEWAKGRAFVVPGPPGAHNWHPMSYSPRTGLVYVPTLDNAWPYIPKPDFEHVPGALNTGEDYPALAPLVRRWLPFCSPAHITAWDPSTRRQVWRVSHDHPINGGILSTAGDLVFQGNGGGLFAAYSAHSGEKLWESHVGIGLMAPPVSYSVDGDQYVAVMAGIGGTPALNYLDLDYENHGLLLSYKLDGAATLPRVKPRKAGTVQAPPLRASEETVARGEKLYSTHCARCHGFVVRGNGFLPDLRHSTRGVHEAWDSIVLGGALRGRGMASFADLIDKAESDAIHSYVIAEAHRKPSLLDRVFEWGRSNVCIPTSWVAN